MNLISTRQKLAALIILLVIIILSFIAGVIFTRHKTIPMAMTTESPWSQNAFNYINKSTQHTPLLSKQQQEKSATYSLRLFFSPWQKYSKKKIQSVFKYEKNYLLKLKAHQQYGIGFHPYPKQFLTSIINNMDMDHFPNMNQNAIIIQNVGTRVIPIALPAFDQPTKNITYPFDVFAGSPLWVGQPVRILNKSRDGAWYLINRNKRSYWIKNNRLVFVDKKFVATYTKHTFVSVIKDNIPAKDNMGNFLFYTRIGSLLPYLHGTVYTAFKNPVTNYADLQPIKIDAPSYVSYPMKATPYNFALIMNALMGEPYTWGLKNYRECSLTIKNVFMTFGIWLPRHSQDQLTYLPHTILSHLSDKRKLQLIQEKAIPFLTLLGTPGHVTLYIGKHNKHHMIFQDRWSYHTRDIFGDQGRLIIGKTVISSLLPPKKNPIVKQYTLTDLSKMTFINNYPNGL